MNRVKYITIFKNQQELDVAIEDASIRGTYSYAPGAVTPEFPFGATPEYDDECGHFWFRTLNADEAFQLAVLLDPTVTRP